VLDSLQVGLCEIGTLVVLVMLSCSYRDGYQKRYDTLCSTASRWGQKAMKEQCVRAVCSNMRTMLYGHVWQRGDHKLVAAISKKMVGAGQLSVWCVGIWGDCKPQRFRSELVFHSVKPATERYFLQNHRCGAAMMHCASSKTRTAAYVESTLQRVHVHVTCDQLSASAVSCIMMCAEGKQT
jgi:hypothetical protein